MSERPDPDGVKPLPGDEALPDDYDDDDDEQNFPDEQQPGI